ncbi:5-oxoprolinase subunit PxpA [Alicyclobacillus sp. SP_1]|uniref:5-oxoprolinase subunit PxpA n=1 Tax=Alicyclobacillus sp. SP_1 TaxID=2942475 RepID=UPI0021570AAF|nr:5-oxoprolinase subunit PxpA [Alicyclobacillus sp. SP_1]
MDLNCDMGESYGRFQVGADAELWPYVTSANLACGFHGGCPLTIQASVDAALAHGVSVGAHPGYPDLMGFGRREMTMSDAEMYTSMVYQISALRGFLAIKGGVLHHVKLHGALYHRASVDRSVARAVVAAIRDVDPTLCVYTLPESVLAEVAQEAQLAVWREGFADRRYAADGRLLPRTHPKALLQTVAEVEEQVRGLMHEGRVIGEDGRPISMVVDTICLHGDGPNAIAFARAAKAVLDAQRR